MTTLPAFSKFTVMRWPIIDWICPRPQSGWLGWRTKSPGLRRPLPGFPNKFPLFPPVGTMKRV